MASYKAHRPDDTTETSMTAARTRSARASLDVLRDLYVWEDDLPVRRLLMEYPEVQSPLIQAASLIPRYFGPNARLSLGVEHDPESKAPPRLAATIYSSQVPRDALANLDRFDDEWWLDAMTPVHHHVSFGLRFE